MPPDPPELEEHPSPRRTALAVATFVLLALAPVFFLAIRGTGPAGHHAMDRPPPPELGSLIPPVAVRDPEDRPLLAGGSADSLRVYWFWSAHCPCTERADVEFARLTRLFADQPIRFHLVAANASEPVQEVRRIARERGIDAELVVDETSALSDATGALATPTAVVLGPDGRLLFRGAPDNSDGWKGATGREPHQPWLERALEAFLSGRRDPVEVRPSLGCAITRRTY